MGTRSRGSLPCNVSETLLRFESHEPEIEAALEKLDRHLGMFKETIKADLAGPDGKPLKADRTVIILPSRGKLNWSKSF
jgi:hypothetical protein